MRFYSVTSVDQLFLIQWTVKFILQKCPKNVKFEKSYFTLAVYSTPNSTFQPHTFSLMKKIIIFLSHACNTPLTVFFRAQHFLVSLIAFSTI